MEIKIDKKFFEPAFPLLDKFRELAPGTYKHCQNVSNICESIAIELDLNVDLIKCSALFHDVGKITNPSFFSENQSNGVNPHDNLDPYISYQIITRHVGDSVLYLLQIEDIPQEVIKIVSQHHGNTILNAFYNKCSNDEPEDKYRYKCSKPTSTEAAILMIVDSIEATSRSIFNSGETEDKFIKEAINSTIERLVDDGQLDNMKIGTLKVVKKILFKELESIYHKRVTYESQKTIGDAKAENNIEVENL